MKVFSYFCIIKSYNNLLNSHSLDLEVVEILANISFLGVKFEVCITFKKSLCNTFHKLTTLEICLQIDIITLIEVKV